VTLARAFEDGLGVPQDYVEAHKWFNLAAPRSKFADIRSDIIARRDALAQKMPPDTAKTRSCHWVSSAFRCL
jgi:uncharacterized protein